MTRTPSGFEPVRYVLGVLFRDPDAWTRVQGDIESVLGPIERTTEPAAFDHSGYYDEEMGAGLKRIFAAAGLGDPAGLPAVKRETTRIEDGARSGRGRTVNLDPGYVDAGNLVLATRRPGAGRIALTDGFSAYLALIYRGGTFAPLPWTYSDYRDPETIAFFNELRGGLIDERRRSASGEKR